VSETETVFFNQGGTTITSSRIVLHGTTYATRNVSSVRAASVPVKMAGPLFAIFLGLFLWGVGRDLQSTSSLVGIGFLAVGVFVLWQRFGQYALMLTTNAGEVRAVVAKDKASIQGLANSIAQARTLAVLPNALR
jgi:Family of unknown function (DUF6232)